jgi:mannose-6-phosphate isomerase-like protein (cupin superfamily)
MVVVVAWARFYIAVRRPPVVAGAFALIASAVAWRLRPRGPEIHDVVAEARRMVADVALPDQGRIYQTTASASVHLHVMGPRQRCPLHVHPNQHEVAVVVTGAAQVDFGAGNAAGGASGVRSAQFGPGDVVHAPPWCAHEWVNLSRERVLAVLVFSSPPWLGNLYVTADERDLPRGQPSTSFRLEEDLASVNAGSAPTLRDVPVAGGHLLLVTTDRPFQVERRASTVLFVRTGWGRLQLPLRAPVLLGPGHLAILPSHAGATFSPEPGQRLAFMVFDLG